MKKLSLFICLITLSLTSFAAEPQTQQGSKGLFFGFNGLSELSVNNTRLGGFYYLGSDMFLWADVGFNIINQKPYKTGDEYASNNIGFEVGLDYLVFKKGSVGLFIGPDIGFTTSSSESEGTRSATKTTKSNSFYAGIGIGAEWWFTDNISIHPYTFIGFESIKTTDEDGSTKIESTSSYFGIQGSQAANLYIMFYF